jgi:hypothetical protein
VPYISNTRDVKEDWAFVPFIDIEVYDADYYDSCPSGMISVFQKIWLGMNIACDCRTAPIKEKKQVLHMGRACDGDTETKCRTV